jgi:hypothetical protein
MRKLTLLSLCACLVALPVAAQEVEMTTLAPPDNFSGGTRDNGIGPDLWRGTSADMARRIIPLIGSKPLTPAGRRLALRVLSTGANAPEGAGDDLALAAARGQALLLLGDPAAANASVERIPGLAASQTLAGVAAETALLTGDDARACAIGDALTEGRGDRYWLQLRAFCQVEAGEPDAARLSLTLANEKSTDRTVTRLMTALMVGGDPGEAAYDSGLQVALSRRLGLPPAPAQVDSDIEVPSPELLATDPLKAARLFVQAGDLDQAVIIRQALVLGETSGLQALDLDLLDALIAAASGQAPASVQDALMVRAVTGGARSPAIPAALYLSALGAPMDGEARNAFSRLDAGKSAISPAQRMSLDLAAEAGLKGETALLVLSMLTEAGASGPTPADRATFIRALRRAGLEEDARALAVEGLMALSAR